MLKRVHIKGYKSLVDVELCLEPLTVLIGVNASGKSNFLDALQLLAGLATSRTVKQAFVRHPWTSASGIKGLSRDRLTPKQTCDLRRGRRSRCGIREMRRRPQDSRSRTRKRVRRLRELRRTVQPS